MCDLHKIDLGLTLGLQIGRGPFILGCGFSMIRVLRSKLESKIKALYNDNFVGFFEKEGGGSPMISSAIKPVCIDGRKLDCFSHLFWLG